MDSVRFFCEHGNEHSHSMKGYKYLGSLRNYYFLQRNSASSDVLVIWHLCNVLLVFSESSGSDCGD
jgi:hypothetical protein